jgi:hypothetical protein
VGWHDQGFRRQVLCFYREAPPGLLHVGRFQINRPWETCTKIGGAWGWSGHGPGMSLADCVILPDVYIADSVRLEFQRWEGRISINQINAYGAPQTQPSRLHNTD